MRVVIQTMEVLKQKEESGMELHKKNYLKQWAPIWIKQVQEIIHYHKWLDKKL